MDSREVIRRLAEAGWELRKVRGSHHHFMHPRLPGKVTVPHPVKDMKIGRSNPSNGNQACA
jgi:predicted RNA binding protein YcfA (HicA-like mRNA interferase family)